MESRNSRRVGYAMAHRPQEEASLEFSPPVERLTEVDIVVGP